MEGTARKEKPGMSKNYSATQSYRNTLDSNRYLTYDILRIIFQYLNARDLGSAAMVCRSWSEAANNEKSIRGPCCFITNPYTEREFLYKMKNIRIKPSTGFFIIPSEIVSWDIEDHIDDLLPKHCKAIMLYSQTFEVDRDDETDEPVYVHQSLVCAFLPQIPNVRIKSFDVSNHRVIQKSAEYQEIISTIVDHETSISNRETSTCFMLFWSDEGYTTAKRWASVMQKSKEVKIASVWGGGLEVVVQPRSRYVPDCIAVLITGSIRTWSTILDKKCNTEKQVEARLKLFKDEVKLKKHSIGFMFACGPRETVEYDESNVESMIFKRLFPKVPLAHCFTHGVVFGKTANIDKVKEEKNDEEKHKCKKSKKSRYNNESSTVFLILTYG